MSAQRQKEPIRGASGAGSAQRQLWCAVLLAAVDDAVTGPVQVTSGVSKEAHARDWHRARAYVLTPNRDFTDVCHLAGLDPIVVREAVAKRCTAHPLPPLPPLKSAPRQKAKGKAKLRALPFERPERTYTFRGETMTLSAWAERTGLPVMILRNRATKGWSAERALMTPPKPARRYRHGTEGERSAYTAETILTHDGEALTLAAWADRLGCEPRIIVLRLGKGWSIARAVTQPVTRRRAPSVSAAAEAPTQAPGAPLDFRPSEGTGAGRHAQDRHELEIPV